MHARSAKPRHGSFWGPIAVLAAVVFVACVRLRVADVPLERDEGEYAHAGRLILHGVPPYATAYNMKFPGTYYAYALILGLFGRTPWAIHFGLLLVNAAAIVLIFRLGRRLLGDLAAAVAAWSFAILSLDQSVLGVFAHATHFVVLPVLISLLLLLRGLDGGRERDFFLSGLFLGTAVTMKQHAVFYLPLASVLVVWAERPGDDDGTRVKAVRIGAIALGSAIAPAVVIAVLSAQGVAGRFWHWTFEYASAYVSENSIATAWSIATTQLARVTAANLALWILAGLGAVALWASGWDRRARIVLTGLLIASILAVCPGFYFRVHYFIVLLPAIALLNGVAIVSLRRTMERRLSPRAASTIAIGVIGLAIALYVARERQFLFTMTPIELSRTRFGSNPFIEAPLVGEYLRAHTDPGDRIAVLGSEPEIYFYADRQSATGYIYTYPLLEPQPYARAMQQEMIGEIEAAHPRYVVFCSSPTSWLPNRGSDQGIFTWARTYLRACYEPVGVANADAADRPHTVWGEDVRVDDERATNLVLTFRRKNDQPCRATN